MKAIVNQNELKHGDRLLIKYELNQGDKEYTEGLKATFLTFENIGTGRMARLNFDRFEGHNHISLNSPDVKAFKLE